MWPLGSAGARVCAPGTIVVAGAASEGAPVLVAAVDRYLVADSARSADRATLEVAAALVREAAGAEPYPHVPWFDTRSLFFDGDRLGARHELGFNAAALVACLAAREVARNPELGHQAIVNRIEEPALAAYRRVHGDASGAEVIASARGGTVVCRRMNGRLEARPAPLPKDLVLEVWARPDGLPAPVARALVRALECRAPVLHRSSMERVARASLAVVAATECKAFCAACRQYLTSLVLLGEASRADLVPECILQLDAEAGIRGATFFPGGAGAGRIAVWAGPAASDGVFARSAHGLGLERMTVTLGARGVHPAPGGLTSMRETDARNHII